MTELRRWQNLIREGTVGIPRRFGTVRVLGLITLFAILFGLFSWLDFHPVAFVIFTLFIGLVGLGQVILFGGREPRRASVVVGAAAGVCIALWAAMHEPIHLREATIVLVVLVAFGALFGYLAGGLLAAVFLIRGRDLDEDEEHSRAAEAEVDASGDPFAD